MILHATLPIHQQTGCNRVSLDRYIVPSSYSQSAASVVISGTYKPASREFRKPRTIPTKPRYPRKRTTSRPSTIRAV